MLVLVPSFMIHSCGVWHSPGVTGNGVLLWVSGWLGTGFLSIGFAGTNEAPKRHTLHDFLHDL